MIDLDELYGRIGRDPELVAELVDYFIEDADDLVGKLVSLTEDRANLDETAIERTAHAIKGAAANLSIAPMRQTAAAIEQGARNGDVSDTPEHAQALASQLVELKALVASGDWQKG